MSPTTTRSLVAALTFAACGLSSAPAGALTIQFATPISPSFWSQQNWSPFPFVPQDGATVVLDNLLAVAPVLHLGDASGIPAQAADLAQLRLQSGDFIVDWASEAPGGTSGSLNFTGTDRNDLGVGIRVGGTGDRAVLALIGANTDPAMASDVVIGPGVDPSAPSGLLLSGPNPGLPAQAGTFHAATISLLGDYSTLEVTGNQGVVAQELILGTPGSPTFGSNVSLSNGATLDVGLLSLFGDVGTALTVDASTVNGLIRASAGSANVAFTNFGSSNVRLEALNGAQLAASSSGFFSDVSISRAEADSTSRIRLDASADGRFAFFDGGLVPLVLDRVDVVAQLAGNVTLDGLLTARASTFDLSGGSGLGGAGSSRPAIFDLDSSSVALHDTSSWIANQVFVRPGSSASLDSSGPAGFGTGVFLSASSLGVGSDFSLRGGPNGGDLPSAASATFDLRNGAGVALRFRPLPLPPFFVSIPPSLALGSQGMLTLDPASAMRIGDDGPFAAGKITLAQNGQLWGSGTINGVSFLSGTHLDVLNTGGLLHPGFSPGRLTIGGSYTQNDGVIEFSIGGSTPISGYSQLLASDGIAISGGTIRFVREAGYAGDLGATLEFLLSPNGVVTVAPGVAIDDQTGLGLAFDFATGSARITQTVPEPAIAALLAAGCVGLAWIGRRRRA